MKRDRSSERERDWSLTLLVGGFFGGRVDEKNLVSFRPCRFRSHKK